MTRKKPARSGSSGGTDTAADLLARAKRLGRRDDNEQSLARALDLLRQAAKQGSAEALYAIGTWYGFGKHLPCDFDEATKYFKRAARKNYGPAVFNLGISYEMGRGVSKDSARAFTLYVQAARLGDFDGAKAVSRCLYYGIGVARDRPLAELIADFYDGTFARRKKEAPLK